MPTYILLAKWTEEGIKSVKQSPQRLQAARQLVQATGGSIKDFYMVMGEYDFIVVAEAPNDEAYARVALAIAAGGTVRTTTLKAFSEEEYRRIVASLP